MTAISNSLFIQLVGQGEQVLSPRWAENSPATHPLLHFRVQQGGRFLERAWKLESKAVLSSWATLSVVLSGISKHPSSLEGRADMSVKEQRIWARSALVRSLISAPATSRAEIWWGTGEKLIFFFWPCHTACGTLVPNQGLNLGPCQWEHRVLTTGPPGNSL